MNDKKVLKAGVGYTIGNYLLKGLGFLTIPIFSRLMSTTEYGMYNIFLSYESILFILIGLALHSSYKNAKYKYESDGTYFNYVSSTIVFIILSFIVWLAAANIFNSFISDITELSRLSINLLVIYSFSNAIIICFNSDAGLRYDYKSFLTISGINAVSNIILSIVLMLTIYKDDRYIARTIGTVLPISVIAIFIVVKFIHRAPPKNTVDNLKWGIKYSLPIVPHGISQVILSQFDRIMIQKMISYSQAVIYSFAYNINTIVTVTTSSLDSVWCPWFYEKMHSKDYVSIRKVSSIYTILVAFFCACLILVSPELIKILGSAEYYDAIYCVIPIVAGGFFAFIYNIPASVEYYYEKTKFIALGTMAAAIINIVLNFVFIKIYGYVAAAYTTLVTYILYFVFHYYLARKIHKSYLFSNIVVVSSALSVVGIMFLARIMINLWIVRWLAAIILFIVALIFEERSMSVIRNFIKKKRGK